MVRLDTENKMESRLSLGPFDLVKQIGKGTMGVVWEGVHRSQALPVAIKILTEAGITPLCAEDIVKLF